MKAATDQGSKSGNWRRIAWISIRYFRRSSTESSADFTVRVRMQPLPDPVLFQQCEEAEGQFFRGALEFLFELRGGLFLPIAQRAAGGLKEILRGVLLDQQAGEESRVRSSHRCMNWSALSKGVVRVGVEQLLTAPRAAHDPPPRPD